MAADPKARIDRAAEIVNARINLLGMNETYSSYEPVYTGLPITHDEGVYLLQLIEREVGEKIGSGVPWESAVAGALHWAFLVGIFVGKDADES